MGFQDHTLFVRASLQAAFNQVMRAEAQIDRQAGKLKEELWETQQDTKEELAEARNLTHRAVLLVTSSLSGGDST